MCIATVKEPLDDRLILPLASVGRSAHLSDKNQNNKIIEINAKLIKMYLLVSEQ